MQPCSQPRYGLIEKVNGTSGESLRVMMVLACSGVTVVEAAGQYRTAAGIIQHEPSWVLQLVHAEDAATEAAIREIRMAYQSQFKQEAVLRMRSKACVSF